MKKRFFLIFILYFCISFNGFSQVDLSLMTFNIWNEGATVNNAANKIRDVILKADPDIVGFEEVRNTGGSWTERITGLLSAQGKNYFGKFVGGDISIISKYPIIESTLINNNANSLAAFKIFMHGQSVIIVVGHLDYDYYGCYLPRGYNGGHPNWNMIDDGTGHPAPVTDIDQILTYNLLSQRDEQIAAFLNYIQFKSEPVIFLGDFNEPSCQDWTASQANLFDHHGVIIPWQCTTTLTNNGFIDAFRNYFPDELNNPGISWPSFVHGYGSTSWTPLADERDRIDFVFYKGDSIQTVYAALVGPKESYDHDTITTSYTENENFIADSLAWPSDHKAVLVKLRFRNLTETGWDGTTKFKYSLDNNYPNPFNPTTNISWQTPEAGRQTIKIFDVLGSEVTTLIDDFRNAGRYTLEFDASKLSSGIYFYTLQSGNYSDSKKMVLLK